MRTGTLLYVFFIHLWTNSTRWKQIRFDETCRLHQRPFYAGGTYGLLGYIFCDLLEHEHLVLYAVQISLKYCSKP